MALLTTALDALVRCGQELRCVVGADRRVVLAAGPWESALGSPAEQLAGAALDEIVHDDYREVVRLRHEAALAGLPHRPFDVELGTGETPRRYEVALDVDGPYVVAAFRDVTHHRRAERSLATLNERLAELNTELRRSNAELERFAYVASHDLSEPLRMVTSYCALLVAHCGNTLDDTAKEYVAFATDGAVRMRALIDDLLSYARVATVTATPVAVDLNAVFADAVRDLEPLIAESRAVVSVERLPTITGNTSQLRQLAANLLGNALKFRALELPPRVRVRARQDGDGITVTVADNGIGIPERHRERIFDMFKRLHGRASYDGNGIGLALCKRIAEHHNGRIWVEPVDSGGSVFHVTLRPFRVVDVTL